LNGVSAEDPDAVGVGERDDLLVALDDLQRRDVGVGQVVGLGAVAEADVVDPLQQDHVLDVGLGSDVALEPGDRVDPAARRVVEHPVAADPLVGDAHRGARQRVQPPRKVVGPAGVGIQRRPDPIGDRVPERHDRSGVARRRHHVDAVEEVPGLGLGPEAGRGRRQRPVAGGHVVDLASLDMLGRAAGRRGQVQAHRDVGQRRHRQPDRV
jgi:hypothetical protein